MKFLYCIYLILVKISHGSKIENKLAKFIPFYSNCSIIDFSHFDYLSSYGDFKIAQYLISNYAVANLGNSTVSLFEKIKGHLKLKIFSGFCSILFGNNFKVINQVSIKDRDFHVFLFEENFKNKKSSSINNLLGNVLMTKIKYKLFLNFLEGTNHIKIFGHCENDGIVKDENAIQVKIHCN